jgi:hypothetical protein
MSGRPFNGVRAAIVAPVGQGWSEYKQLYSEVESLSSIANAL